MTSNMMIIAGIAVLAIGTYLMRFAGVKLGNRVMMSEHLHRLRSDAAPTLLFAVAPGNSFYEGVHFAGFARVLGVTVAVVFAWQKMPLIIVIFAAALVTALLHYADIQ